MQVYVTRTPDRLRSDASLRSILSYTELENLKYQSIGLNLPKTRDLRIRRVQTLRRDAWLQLRIVQIRELVPKNKD